MSDINGIQLYGIRRLAATLKMARHKELRGLSIKQKLALNYVNKESKLTRMDDGRIFTNTFTPYYPSVAYDRFLHGLRQIIAGQPYPIVTNFAVTPRCPCNCWHCSFSDRAAREELPLERLKSAITEVQQLGVSVIGITGGEPLLRDDLEEIIAAIGPHSMPLLFTTGYKLTIERVRALKQAGLGIPVISLDHYKAEVHDAGRRAKGFYEHALNAIELFQREGFYVAVSFVPSRELVEDKDELYKVIDFFRSLGINDMRLTSPILSGKLVAKPDSLLSAAHRRTIWELQRKCTSTKGYPGVFAYDFFESEHYYGCGAGFNYMFIDAQGNLCPCDFTMLSVGNIKERPIAELWRETNRLFCQPGHSCYANRCNDTVAGKKSKIWPLTPELTRQVIKECPPFDAQRIPVFYKKARRS